MDLTPACSFWQFSDPVILSSRSSIRYGCGTALTRTCLVRDQLHLTRTVVLHVYVYNFSSMRNAGASMAAESHLLSFCVAPQLTLVIQPQVPMHRRLQKSKEMQHSS